MDSPDPSPSSATPPIVDAVDADAVDTVAADPSVSLARKWRPKRFADIVGQDYVVDAVRRAARRHHAYLFSGTRGVGKTTLARVLAMLLNCRDENAADPCGVCPNCRDIVAGKFTAVMELDAASLKSGAGDTQVGQIRELMDEMSYAPPQGRFRVLIIDEAHALGAGPKAPAFNPLLKTLEEPPPRARFILATTDPQRLPATVRSRCLCFSLSPIPRAVIADRLAAILRAENIAFEPDAVNEIARLGRGSLRDALSILDQVAHGGDILQAAQVRRIVGASSIPVLAEILRAVGENDPAAAMQGAAALADQNADFAEALQQMAALVFRASLRHAVPEAADESDPDGEEDRAVRAVAAAFPPEELQALYEIAVRGRAQLPFAPDEKTGFEMTLLRMTLFSPMRAAGNDHAPAGTARAPGTVAAKTSAQPSTPTTREKIAAGPKTDLPPEAARKLPWAELTRLVSETGRALATHCREVARDENGITLALDLSRKSAKIFESALAADLKKLCGDAFALRLELGTDDAVSDGRARAAQAAADADPFVRGMREKVPGAIVEVRPSSANNDANDAAAGGDAAGADADADADPEQAKE